MIHMKKTGLAVLISTLIGVQGCSTISNEQTQQLADRELALKDREAQLIKREQLIAQKNRNAQTLAHAPVQSDSSLLLPPNANLGECYARLWVEPTYETISTTKLVKEASSSVEIIPASYEWIEEEVLVSEKSSRIESIAPVYGEESFKIKVAEERREWRVDTGHHAAPASSSLLATAEKYGIDLSEAEPNMCYHEHYIPATYETVTEDVLISEASTRIETIAATYEMIEESVLVKDAYTILETVPAVFETQYEQIIDKPAHQVWKKGSGPIQKLDESTGEIMCLVEVPATYKRIGKRVLVSAASTNNVEVAAQYKIVKVKKLVSAPSQIVIDIPAKYRSISKKEMTSNTNFTWHEVHNLSMSKATRTGNKICLDVMPERYETITKRVIVTPASSNTIDIPAVYESIKVKKLPSQSRVVNTDIPAVYQDITSQNKVTDGFMEWRSILCETNMTTSRIQAIQVALQEKGFDPGNIDGIIGLDTMNAVNAFQRDSDLPLDKYLNVATIEALGVSPR